MCLQQSVSRKQVIAPTHLEPAFENEPILGLRVDLEEPVDVLLGLVHAVNVEEENPGIVKGLDNKDGIFGRGNNTILIFQQEQHFFTFYHHKSIILPDTFLCTKRLTNFNGKEATINRALDGSTYPS